MNMDAIVLRNVSKEFRKKTVRREYTTLKSELVQFLKRKETRPSPVAVPTLYETSRSSSPGDAPSDWWAATGQVRALC